MPKPYKLLYTAGADISENNGPGINEREFTQALQDRNDLDVTFLLPKPQHPERTAHLNNAFFLATGPRAMRHIIYTNVCQPLTLAWMIRSKKWDGVIIRTSFLPLANAAFLPNISVPVFLKTQGSPHQSSIYYKPGLIGSIARALRAINTSAHKKIIRSANVVDCCTPQMVEAVQELKKPQNTKGVYHVDNATNTNLFRPIEKDYCRKKLGLQEQGPIIGYAGGAPETRGGAHILHAVRQLSDDFPNIVGCILGGSEKEKQQLQQKARSLGIENKCIILGTINYEEVVYWINSWDAGVALDIPEKIKHIGSSNQKIRQYLACGVPTVASIETSNFIQEKNIGVLVDPENLQNAIEGIRQILNGSKTYLTSASRRAREYAEQNFSINSAIEKRMQLWEPYLN